MHLRRAEPALRADHARVSQAKDFERVLVLHRWIEGVGRDVVVVASFDELPKQGYTIGLPSAGDWREIFNTDAYERFPNPEVVGNGGTVRAWGAPRDDFSASATLTLPANGAIVLAKP